MAHILVVDDEAGFRAMLSQVLRDAGHMVSEAASGAAVLPNLIATPADLLLTDLVMPEKEGIETIVTVRRAFPKLPIIAMSGSVFGGAYLEMARRLGANRVLSKPFTMAQLIAEVESVLSAQ